jgi:type I restriction enzyme S subunit
MEKKIPKLRFPEFEGEWVEKKFGNVFTFKSTNSYSRINLNYEFGQVKNIHYGDIHTKFQTLFDVNKEIVPFVNTEISYDKISEDNYCQEGDLILADASEDLDDVGKSIEIINIGNQKVLSGLHTILARPTKNLFCFGFNGYLFKSKNIRTQIQKESQGSKVLSISTTRLSNITLNFPKREEQTKIANFLSAVDNKITHLKKKKELLVQYKKGVMQKIFSQELRFKDENGEDFAEWEEKKLGEIGETYNGLTGKSKENFGQGKPYIQYKQIFDDSKIDISRFHLVDISSSDKQNKVKYGDIFFTVSSETPDEVGISSVLLDEVDDLYLNSFCFGYRPFSLQILNPFYAQFLFRSELFRREVILLAQGSTRYNLSKAGMMKIIINLPSLPEQTKIANFLSAIDDKISHCGVQIEKMEVWKKGLLQQMFV